MPSSSGLSSQKKNSVRLCCTSGDGKAIFSLHFEGIDGYFLERRALPLHNEANEPNPPQRAKLPHVVQTGLDLSAPVEILCVEGENPKQSKSSSTQAKGQGDNSIAPCLLCVYSRSEVFYLEMKMNDLGECVVEATVAYEMYFLNADEAVSIVRVRAAPQRRMDYATFNPRGAMAMLTHNPYSNEYALVLQHSDGDLVSMPLSFYMEESSESGEDITDFCFAQSDELSLLSTLSILLLKGSGSVHAASPILFDGSVVHKSALVETMDLIEYQMDTLGSQDPKHKQCRAAKAFLLDAFGEPDGQGNFLTARVLTQAGCYTAVSWAVKIQGPILRPNNDGAGCAVSIENFSTSELIGVAVGGEGHAVDLGIVSPSCLLPRFSLENPEDGYAIDDKLTKAGALVQRLILSEEGPTRMPITNQSVALIRDTMVDSMLHYVTASGVMTLDSTAMRHALRKIHGKSADTSNKSSAVRNSAWASVSVSSGSVEGAVVGTDTRFGHGLYVKLSDGSFSPVNITESRYLHEMEHLIKPDAQQLTVAPSHNISDGALKRVEELPPLYEEIEPLLKKVATGIGGLGKLVGSNTKSSDITPEQLAVVLNVKQRCDKEVVLPLLELKRTILSRREILKSMYKYQKKQITALKASLGSMQQRMLNLKENTEKAQGNAADLAKRVDAVFQASQGLQPSITQAEHAYFEYLKKQKAKLVSVENTGKKVIEQTAVVQEKIKKGEITCTFQLSDANITNADKLLDGQEKLVGDIEFMLKENERITAQMSSQSGIPIPSSH